MRVLVSIGVFQYVRTLFGSRRGMRQGRRVRRSVRVLRKIDRILSEATTSQNNIISYRDHGLLVELANLKGIQVQMKALERIRWAYAEWLGRMK